MATWNSELSRKHPTLLYRDIVRGGAADIGVAVELIAKVRPDILVLQSFDYDLHGHALAGFADELTQVGWDMPNRFAGAPNTGVMTDVDLDGDGRTHTPRDAQGYGWFAGQGGMAILSRHPILYDRVVDHSKLIWARIPWARLPDAPNAMSLEARQAQKLSTTAHWEIPVQTPTGVLNLWTSHHTPPVFDGPEDRNGYRNADELRIWYRKLASTPDAFVALGDFNLDPNQGEGQRDVIVDMLSHPALRDPQPADAEGGTDTVDFGRDIGKLRVSYVLPAACIQVTDSGLDWPSPRGGDRVSRHALVWVDLRLDGRCQGADG